MKEQHAAEKAAMTAAADKAASEHTATMEAQREELKGVLASLDTELTNIDEKVRSLTANCR
jgi:hypothetical protein